MIEKLQLTNFKCFQEDKIDFKSLTMLTGANASGKSSVIQALLLLHYTNELMLNKGKRWYEEAIDINKVFGFQIGAPNALISQNPVEDETCDFAFVIEEMGKEYSFQYAKEDFDPDRTVLILKFIKKQAIKARTRELLSAMDDVEAMGKNKTRTYRLRKVR